MQVLAPYLQLFEQYNSLQLNNPQPQNLYQPMSYILALGGKRIRPALTLLATDIFGGEPTQALPAAAAIEWFHNFSLIHDDIMDNAPIRRGKPTVHTHWNTNIGILSGDAMLVKAYQFLENYPPEILPKLLTLFNTTALQVCEGQQYDMDFETQTNVSEQQYIQMIQYKTAVLVATALKMGALIAQSPQAETIYQYGLHLGTAFQLQDDYLDVFGNPQTFGKQVGGDIIENKKTYLYIKALQLHSNPQELLDLYSINPPDTIQKVQIVTQIYQQSGAAQATQQHIQHHTHKALEYLQQLHITPQNQKKLIQFTNQLMERNT